MQLFDEGLMELLLLVAAHASQRPFKDDAALLLDIFHEARGGGGGAWHFLLPRSQTRARTRTLAQPFSRSAD